MKLMLKILIGFAILIGILLLIALFTKKDYSLERQITINRPVENVFDFIKVLKNSEYYNQFVLMDPKSKKEYRGTDGTKGFVFAWESKNNKGEQIIENIVEKQRIDYNLHFIKPFEGNSKSYLITEPVSGNETKVRWGFSGTMPYPMNIMLVFMNVENSLGKNLDQSLIYLKRILEKQ